MKKHYLPLWVTTVTPFSKYLALSMLVMLPVMAFFFGRWYEDIQIEYNFELTPRTTRAIKPLYPKEYTVPTPVVLPLAEKQRIDAWIQANNLNEFGDAKDTTYTGGSPLFDEADGTTIDRYNYILKRHPDRPWRK